MSHVARLGELHQLEPRVIIVDGEQVALVRIRDDVYAFSPMCTHRDAPLLEGAVTWNAVIMCPWHLGTFNLRAGGTPLGGPVEAPLPCHRVRIEGDKVYVTLAHRP